MCVCVCMCELERANMRGVVGVGSWVVVVGGLGEAIMCVSSFLWFVIAAQKNWCETLRAKLKCFAALALSSCARLVGICWVCVCVSANDWCLRGSPISAPTYVLRCFYRPATARQCTHLFFFCFMFCMHTYDFLRGFMAIDWCVCVNVFAYTLPYYLHIIYSYVDVCVQSTCYVHTYLILQYRFECKQQTFE